MTIDPAHHCQELRGALDVYHAARVPFEAAMDRKLKAVKILSFETEDVALDEAGEDLADAERDLSDARVWLVAALEKISPLFPQAAEPLGTENRSASSGAPQGEPDATVEERVAASLYENPAD